MTHESSAIQNAANARPDGLGEISSALVIMARITQTRGLMSRSIVIVLLFSLLVIHSAGAADKPGETRWFKGNLHTHSLWSDGNDFPEMIADWYKSNGY